MGIRAVGVELFHAATHDVSNRVVYFRNHTKGPESVS